MSAFFRLRRHSVAGLFGLSLIFAVGGLGADTVSASPPVRSEMVLKVGPADISWYAVDKNLARFRHFGRPGDVLRAGGESGWFEWYLARQVMIAEALNQGYAERAEVVRLVQAMERQQLAQLADLPPPPTELELHAAYERAPAPAGRAKPAFEELRPALEQGFVQQRRIELHRTRRERALAEAAVVVVPGTAETVIRLIHPEAPFAREIPAEALAAVAGDPLASYRFGDEVISLTVEAWRDQFNHQFIRALPADPAQLKMNIEDFVVTEYAGRDARRQGADREPRFVEDRRNFLYYQALDLFEKEQLWPRAGITAAEMETYYRENLQEFSRPVRARGKLLRFDDEGAALAWLRVQPQAPPVSAEEIAVSRASPIPGAVRMTESILLREAGHPIGPIRTPAGVMIFCKQSSESEPRPYPEVAELIRAKLIQPRLETIERTLAREWATRYAIEDRLRPEEFGVTNPVRKPWAASE